MTATSSIQLKDQLALRIENEVRQQMDSILEKIKSLASEFKIAQEDEKSPFRNVLAVAVEPSSSLEIIKNYIRYQVGRGGGASRIWSLKKGDSLFARQLVDELDNLSGDVDAVLTRVEDSLPNEDDLLVYLVDDDNRKVVARSLHLELAQLYLGYLAREHTAQVGEKSASKSSDKSDGDRATKGNSSQSKGKPNKPKKPNRR